MRIEYPNIEGRRQKESERVWKSHFASIPMPLNEKKRKKLNAKTQIKMNFLHLIVRHWCVSAAFVLRRFLCSVYGSAISIVIFVFEYIFSPEKDHLTAKRESRRNEKLMDETNVYKSYVKIIVNLFVALCGVCVCVISMRINNK